MWTEDRERKWEVDDVIVPIQRESVQEGCFGGGGGNVDGVLWGSRC